jgi:NADP-dependent 3-hydroxy acid dehydrogenase YdfG
MGQVGGEVAIITGGTSGIGADSAATLPREGGMRGGARPRWN